MAISRRTTTRWRARRANSLSSTAIRLSSSVRMSTIIKKHRLSRRRQRFPDFAVIEQLRQHREVGSPPPGGGGGPAILGRMSRSAFSSRERCFTARWCARNNYAAACCASAFTTADRMLGRRTASQITSPSTAPFLWRFWCAGGIKLTSWPIASGSRARNACNHLFSVPLDDVAKLQRSRAAYLLLSRG